MPCAFAVSRLLCPATKHQARSKGTSTAPGQPVRRPTAGRRSARAGGCAGVVGRVRRPFAARWRSARRGGGNPNRRESVPRPVSVSVTSLNVNQCSQSLKNTSDNKNALTRSRMRGTRLKTKMWNQTLPSPVPRASPRSVTLTVSTQHIKTTEWVRSSRDNLLRSGERGGRGTARSRASSLSLSLSLRSFSLPLSACLRRLVSVRRPDASAYEPAGTRRVGYSKRSSRAARTRSWDRWPRPSAAGRSC